MIVIAILILVVVFYVFSSRDNSQNKVKAVKINDLSTLMLTINDFPQGQGWTLKDRAERGRTDVSDYGLNLGWKRGYYATYLRGELNTENLDYSRIDMSISEYPPENISLILKDEEDDNSTRYDSLSSPNIGDESKAFKVIYTDEYGNEEIAYKVEFRKHNLYLAFFNYGTRTDYELLKELARKAETKF